MRAMPPYAPADIQIVSMAIKATQSSTPRLNIHLRIVLWTQTWLCQVFQLSWNFYNWLSSTADWMMITSPFTLMPPANTNIPTVACIIVNRFWNTEQTSGLFYEPRHYVIKFSSQSRTSITDVALQTWLYWISLPWFSCCMPTLGLCLSY